MAATTTKFNVGGTVFEVAVSTIQSQPEGLLAKMIDGRFPCGKDESGAFFVDRNPRFFEIVLDVHRDNKVYPLPPGVTRERALAELEFYGLQDFEADPMDFSGEATLRSVGDATREFRKWQHEHARVGKKMMIEGYARLLLAKADLVKGPRSTTLKTSPLDLNTCLLSAQGVMYANSCQLGIAGIEESNTEVGTEMVALLAQCRMKATFTPQKDAKNVAVAGRNFCPAYITLEPTEPSPGAIGSAEPIKG
ncbi:BTB/POZ protein [Baffinella frigidus]|nr:BTB/POZ protein [Cryptophyta sp. CCMP2293]